MGTMIKRFRSTRPTIAIINGYTHLMCREKEKNIVTQFFALLKISLVTVWHNPMAKDDTILRI